MLSIIIPYHNTKKYTDELLDVLKAQITGETEVLLIDDGSEEPYISEYPWLTIMWIKHGGVSKARNAGLNIAIGDYIAFIDSDDIVSKDYVKNILERIEKDPDYIDLSWKSLTPEGMQFNCRATSTQRLINPSVCTRIFKRSFIGGLRFNEDKDIGEDEEFTRKLNINRGKRAFITPYMYFYRTTTENSAIKRYKAGLKKTKKVIYNIPIVTADMVDLVEQIKEDDKKNVVFLFTNRNDIPELERHCQIMRPCRAWAHIVKGEKSEMIETIKEPIETQVVLYINNSPGYDGIMTSIYNFCVNLKDRYDIAVLYDALPYTEINRLRKHVRVIKSGEYPLIKCDTLLMMRLASEIPNVEYKNIYQLVHCIKGQNIKRDNCIFVSETSRKSYGIDGKVIHNLANPEKPEKILTLVSTSRIGASDKGEQDKRMLRLTDMLNSQRIKYLWFYFSTNTLHGAPENMIRVNPATDVRDFLKRADYLVHLSDNEAYCYSITEALSMGVPVIVTDIPVLKELGFKDKKHGYIIDDNTDVKQFLKIPKFKAFNVDDNEKIITEWVDVLGNTTPKHDYKPEKMELVRVIKVYKDMQLNQTFTPGAVIEVYKDRANHLKELGLVEGV